MFACEQADVVPDICCVGKALTSGTLGMAATAARQHVWDEFLSDEPIHALMHGPTFMGNPLACAAAGASLDLLATGAWQEQVDAISARLSEELEPCRALRSVADVRVLGAIGVIELHSPVEMRTVQPAFVDRGVWIRPFGRLVYTMPPYVTESEDVSRITQAIFDVVSAL